MKLARMRHLCDEVGPYHLLLCYSDNFNILLLQPTWEAYP
jgi:hypothetical protein